MNKDFEENNHFTLKEVLNSVTFYTAMLKSKILIIALTGFLFGGFSLIKDITTPTKYRAELGFIVNDDDGSGMSGISSVIGQFGLGSVINKPNYSYDKIIYISKSDKVIYPLFQDSIKYDGRLDNIANHLIKLYDLQKAWEGTILEGFEYTTYDGSLKNNRALKSLKEILLGNPDKNDAGLVAISYNDENGVILLSYKSEFEELSISIAENHYKRLSEFYIKRTVGRQARTYNNLLNKSDSIKSLLVDAEQKLAVNQDRSLGLVLQQDKLLELQNLKDVEMYSQIYGEVLKNLETAKFYLDNSTPFFQEINTPSLPLEEINPSIFKNTVIGILIGLVLSSICVIAYFYYYKSLRPLLGDWQA